MVNRKKGLLFTSCKCLKRVFSSNVTQRFMAPPISFSWAGQNNIVIKTQIKVLVDSNFSASGSYTLMTLHVQTFFQFLTVFWKNSQKKPPNDEIFHLAAISKLATIKVTSLDGSLAHEYQCPTWESIWPKKWVGPNWPVTQFRLQRCKPSSIKQSLLAYKPCVLVILRPRRHRKKTLGPATAPTTQIPIFKGFISVIFSIFNLWPDS